MNDERHQEMLLDYLQGNLDEAQLQEFQTLVESGQIREEELQTLQATYAAFDQLPAPEPGPGMEAKFRHMLAAAHKEQAGLDKPQYTWGGLWEHLQALLSPLKVAYTLIVFGLGFLVAWLAFVPGQQQYDTDVQVLAAELGQVKQMLFTTLIEQPAAVDRLKAVNISRELPEADEKVIDALFHSLNQDPNVNVRLAAIEALKKHTAKPEVREQLILSINGQESPMVQLALADLMQTLQEKNAVPQLRQLLQDKNTNEMVRDRIQESINILI
ncbi:HEAT repeat domain-containing protein [Pontibacter roseus]|uniref:HEAT repeat domain-containing protein n=1 Tax=Pontibacter roseus TaxID=336989 RepID=UPI00035CCC17|nr:HEAT repeat domain-containing protein [Pontibacter roseus]